MNGPPYVAVQSVYTRRLSSQPLRHSDPFLKWAGGKRALADQIMPFVTSVEGTYFEPFLGGAAIFFAIRPSRAVLSDVNAELMECYAAVRDQPEAIAEKLAEMPNTKENYYKVRASQPVLKLGRATRLIYLTTLSFNGIYRQNLRGFVNVPYGYKHTKRMPSLGELVVASVALKNADLLNLDFEEATALAREGDTVYFDPPYTVAHNNNGFVKYNSSIFSWQDQRRLAAHAAMLASRGCRVVVSNADHYSLRDLYPLFRTTVVHRHSVIAANSANRVQITECLFTSPNLEFSISPSSA